MSQLVPEVRTRSRVLGFVSVVVALVVAVALVIGVGVRAEAQSSDRVLLSNIGQNTTHTVSTTTYDVAQKFTTGANVGGYSLASVELNMFAGTGATHPVPSVKVVSGSADGTDVVATLTTTTVNLTGATATNVTYTAPTGTVLAASTDYWVVAERNGTTGTTWRRVGSATLDSSSAAGWSVHDHVERRTQGTTGSFTELSSTTPARLRVNGKLLEAPPYVLSNLNQTDGTAQDFTTLDRAQGFRTGSHPAGYDLNSLVLASSDLTTAGVANAPTVALYAGSPSGTKVADLTAPTSVPTNGQLEYTAPADTILHGGTTYWMVATGGSSSGKWKQSATVTADAGAAPQWQLYGKASHRTSGGTGAFTEATGTAALKLGVDAAPVIEFLGGNIGQTGAGSRSTGSLDLSQGFTTGRNANGFDLAEVQLRLTVTTAPTVALYDDAGTKVADLEGPDSYETGVRNYVFTPSAAVTLAASTEYFVWVTGGSASWATTASDDEDTGTHTGFSVSDVGRRRTTSPLGAWNTHASAHMLGLRGEMNPVDAVVLASNIAKTTGSAQVALGTSDVAQSFRRAGRPAGSRWFALTSVDLQIRHTGSSAAALPTVSLYEGDPTSLTSWVWLTDLVGDENTASTGTAGAPKRFWAYAPGTTDISPVTLKSGTDYFVVAEGGAVEIMGTTSASEDDGIIGNKGAVRGSTSTGVFSAHATLAFRIAVNGSYLSVPPRSAAPPVEARTVARVPGALRVDLHAFDIFAFSASDISPVWQRFSADGTTLEEASIGTDETYRLTAADVGKKIRAVVTYTDSGGYLKGPVTSTLSPVIQAAAPCAAPTLTSDAVQLLGEDNPPMGTTLVVSGTGNDGYGFIPDDHSRLDDSDFTFPGDSALNIEALAVFDDTTNFLLFELDGPLSGTQQRQTTLYVCDDAYPLNDATVERAGSGNWKYIWEDNTLDWSDEAGFMIRVVQDATAPTFESATVNGASLVVTFSEELGEAATLANGAFTVMKTPDGGTAETVALHSTTAPAISGATVTLTLTTADAVTATDGDVTVAYVKPSGTGTNKVTDVFGNDVATFTAQTVTNLLAIGNTVPAFDVTEVNYSLAENNTTAANVGAKTATDRDLDDLLYSVAAATDDSDGTAHLTNFKNHFKLDDESGQVSVKSGVTLNFEAIASYKVKYQVTDSEDASGMDETGDPTIDDTLVLTITVNNVNEAGAVSINGTVAAGKTLMATLVDPDGAVTTSSLSWKWAWSATQTGTFTNITTATTDTYTVDAGDADRYLRATATYSDPVFVSAGDQTAAVTTGQVGAAGADRVFISNLGQTTTLAVDLDDKDVIQIFTTGSNPGGYLLSSVTIGLDAGSGTESYPNVRIVAGSEAIGDERVTLTTAETGTFTGQADVVYTAPADTVLDARQDYSVLVTRSGSSGPSWKLLSSPALDDGRAVGWSMYDYTRQKDQGQTANFRKPAGADRPANLRINGSLLDAARLALSNLRQPDGGAPGFNADRAQGFRTGDHPVGYDLASLLLASKDLGDAANAPTVTLHVGRPSGTKVADFIAPTSIPTNGWLEYTPTAPVVLHGGTTYFMVATGAAATAGKWQEATNTVIDHGSAPLWGIGSRGWSRAGSTGTFTQYSADIALKYGVRATPIIHSLSGNIAQPRSGANSTATLDLGQAFTAGRNVNGYDLAEVHLPLAVTTAPTSVILHDSTGAKIADLWGPDIYGAGEQTYVFTPSVPVTLAAGTEYLVTIKGGDVSWATTASDGEDPGGHPGLLVADTGLTRASGSNALVPYTDTADAHKLGFHGNVNPQATAALTSNAGPDQLAGSADTAFSASDIAQSFTLFGKGDRGYALTSIGVQLLYTGNSIADRPDVSLYEGDPTDKTTWVWLRDLGGSGGITNTGTEGTLARFDASHAGTTSIVPVTLKGNTEYFVLVEGKADSVVKVMSTTSTDQTGQAGMLIANKGAIRGRASTGALSDTNPNAIFRIAVNGYHLPRLPLMDAPQTEPAGTVFGLPGVLRVNLGHFDFFGGEVSNDSYKWQRFAADGVTVLDNNIGTDKFYRLQDADAGNTVKVVATYTDIYGHLKGPVATEASPVIAAAAACAAPTLVGEAEKLSESTLVVGGPITDSVSNTDGYGYVLDSTSQLDNREFTPVGGTERTIQWLAVFPDSTSNYLLLELDAAVTADEKRQLTVYACDEAFALKDSAETTVADGVQYRWNDNSLDWSARAGFKVTVAQDRVAPTFESAVVDGASLVITFTEELGAAASLVNGAFTVMKTPDGGTAETADLTGTPSISGATVTLTLTAADAVVATDTDVTVAYSKQSGSANKVTDVFGNDTADFTAQMVTNKLAIDTTPPVPTAAALDAAGKTLTLTFDDELDTASVPAASAFTVEATPSGGTQATMALDGTTPVAISGMTVVLKTDRPMAHNDAVVVSYAPPMSGAKLQNVVAEGTSLEAAAITDYTVANGSLIPRISVEALHADASPYVARPQIKFTRSGSSTSRLDFRLSHVSAASYFTTSDRTNNIAAGEASRTSTYDFKLGINDVNVSGPLTFSLVESDDYLPAVAPGDRTAVVQVKLAASGPTAWLEFPTKSLDVEEGKSVDVPVKLRAAQGAATPREDSTVGFFTSPGTATHDVDYLHKTENLSFLVAAWSAVSGDGFEAPATFTVSTRQDTDIEGSETFIVGARATPGQGSVVVPSTDAERATVTIVDDEAPPNQPPVFTDATAGLSVAENTTTGVLLDAAYTADDPDMDTLAYSVAVTGPGAGPVGDLRAFERDFSVNSATGQIRVKSSARIDFETRSTYIVHYTVSDEMSLLGAADTEVDDTLVLTVTVSNRNDPGTVSVGGGGAVGARRDVNSGAE